MREPAIPVALVAAMASNRVIGNVAEMASNGVIGNWRGMPWHLASDLRRFRRLTKGKPLVMGRVTCESIGRALPGRDNIVICSRHCAVRGVVCAPSLARALELATDSARRSGAREIAVIGGVRVFEEALPLARRLYLTEVLAVPDGNRWMPPIDFEQWHELKRYERDAGVGDDHPSRFRAFERSLS